MAKNTDRKLNAVELTRKSSVSAHYDALVQAVRQGDVDRQDFYIQTVEKMLEGVACDTLMHRAASLEDVAVIQLLASKGHDVNARNSAGETPLHMAHNNTRKDTVAALIALGADVNALDDDQNTPLHLLVKSPWQEPALALLKAKPDISLKNKEGDTALTIAVSWSYEDRDDLIRGLIDAGSDINHKRVDGKTPIRLAITNNYAEATEILLEKGARIDLEYSRSTYYPLHYAALNGATDVAEMLIKKGHDVNFMMAGEMTPLHIACSLSEDKFSSILVKSLIFAGADTEALDADKLKPVQHMHPNVKRWFMPEYQEIVRTRVAEAVSEYADGSAKRRKMRAL